MARRQAKIKAFTEIWLMASYLCEGIENGKFIKLSDNMEDLVSHNEATISEAKKVQMEIYLESERIYNKITRMKVAENNKNL